MRSVLSVSLPGKMSAELDAIAEETGRSKSYIVKASLGEYLWENRFRRMKKRVNPKAKALGFITDDDVFKELFA
ncbi:MAG: ribbon-helix-helix domain-containing protein [Syntrophales bacterium]|jgi:predicted transcriptional regulator|nr:ribbon-helix-helix domain-containing protein [Syntrophales bacterium]